MFAEAGTRLWRLSDQEVAAVIQRGQERLAAAAAQVLEGLAELSARGADLGFRDLAAFQVDNLNVSPRQAKQRVELAEALFRGDLAGPAELAATGAALVAGEISPEHAAEIHRAITALPVAARAGLEDILLDLARTAPPTAVRKAGAHIKATVDQDGPPPEDAEVSPRREFRSKVDRHGRYRFAGVLDPETGATLDGLFDVLAKPHPAEEGVPDLRDQAERKGDALAEIVDLVARTEDLHTQAGERAVVTVTVTLEDLERRAGAALDGAGYLSASALSRLCCEAKLVPAVFGSDGEVLHLGREARLATKAQRRALALRDRGCAFPGCTRKPRWCVVHHVREWQHGGRTNVDEMVLLCGRHHRVIHHTDWTVTMVDGKPRFHPPAWLTRRRRPSSNLFHRIPA
ncbi:HNH endonuclease signature motif containing protein [Amycolatopsis suaedae]|uniref:HNH endonuclease n=1 Tax=Amycolatopsis suaedae TaxID=2510978 RepID=A0A4Q7J124_9PSEU|nr:HNH endonuclease signature motif containing protein [Amycolatopsis suaedae]RZQ61071.1 HNH endonuclease [Amycolatopsis suaedae]